MLEEAVKIQLAIEKFGKMTEAQFFWTVLSIFLNLFCIWIVFICNGSYLVRFCYSVTKVSIRQTEVNQGKSEDVTDNKGSHFNYL